MASYLDGKGFGTLIKIFIRNLCISNEDVIRFVNLKEEDVGTLYIIEDLSILSDEFLESLQRLVSFYMNIEVFNKQVKDDEEEYCWVIGKRLSRLLEEEHKKRLPEEIVIQRKREQ